MGNPFELSNQDMSQLIEKRTALGLGPKKTAPNIPNICESDLTEEITNRVINKLKKDLIK